jgi:hypothetical protein
METASDNNYKVYEFEVSEENSFLITTKCNWGNCLFSILNKNNECISLFPSVSGKAAFVEINNAQIDIPPNGKKLLVGGYGSDTIVVLQTGGAKRYCSTIKTNRFISVKSEEYKPHLAFNKIKVLMDSSQFSAGDWRSVYPGLGYDVVYDESAELYRMFYAAYNGTITQIGTMSSSDLITWTQGDNPILTPSGIDNDPDKGGMTFPQLLHYGNQWIMYYVGYDMQGFERGEHTICYATSTDLLNWTRRGEIIDKSIFEPSGDDIQVLYRPNVRNYFGKYFMFINAGHGDASQGGDSESIYVLQSDNPISGWEYVGKCVDSTILYAESGYKICSDPCVVTNGKKFYMVCWSNEGVIGFYSDFNEFPMNWHYVGKLFTGMRPLVIPTNEKLLCVSNEGSPTVVSLYRALWN